MKPEELKALTLEQKCAALLKVEDAMRPLEVKKREIDALIRQLRTDEDALREAITAEMLENGCVEHEHGHLVFRVKNKPFGITVTDEAAIPADWFEVRTERKLKLAQLKDAVKNGMAVPGISRDNGGHVIEIRAKGRHS